jgi:hypothetical protein
MAKTPELPPLLPPSILPTTNTGNARTGGVSKRPPPVVTPGSTRPTHTDKRVHIVSSVPAPACGVSASAGAEFITATSTDTVPPEPAHRRSRGGGDARALEQRRCAGEGVPCGHGSTVHILGVQFVDPGLVESEV